MLCVSRAVLSVVLGAWSVRRVGWADWVDCRCFLSFVFLGNARRLELSPCNTPVCCAPGGPPRSPPTGPLRRMHVHRLMIRSDSRQLDVICTRLETEYITYVVHICSYKKVKGRSHSEEERVSMHSHRRHAASQPSLNRSHNYIFVSPLLYFVSWIGHQAASTQAGNCHQWQL